MPRWTERLPTALHNVHALRGWGLREFDNLTLFLRLGRLAGLGMTQPAFLRKLLDTLTRLPLREQSVDRVVQAAIIVYGLVVAHNTLLYLSVG